MHADQIQWVCSDRNFVNMYVGNELFRIRETMASLEMRIAPPLVRVHKSTIVNLDFIAEMQMRSGGDCSILMQDGTELLLSRRYRQRLHWLFKHVL